MTFAQFAKAKSKSWFDRVKGRDTPKKTPADVVIYIGIISWHEKSGVVKPVRGKRVCLRIKSDATYEDIRDAGLKRMKDFHWEVIEDDVDYLLAFESGKIAYFIPGTTEDFLLSKYKQELGKEYKQITLYLVSESDKLILEKTANNLFDNDNNDSYTSSLIDERRCKKLKLSSPEKQTDEEFAENLQLYFDQELLEAIPDMPLSEITKPLLEPSLLPTHDHQPKESVSITTILEELARNINWDKQFFLNVRRRSDLLRILSLWGRQNKQSPEMKLVVNFIGENGIDSGALSKEFLTDVLQKIATSMFPGGAPKESMSDVQNGNFLYCGQIMAVSLVQGGPPPNFLHKSVYNLLFDEINIRQLDLNEHFVPNDQMLLNEIRSDPVGCSTIIIDNGYNGVINKDNIEEILETMMISIMTRRQTYMSEVKNGLKLFGLHQKIIEQKDVMESLFVRTESLEVDSRYVLSLLKPIFSSESSSKRIIEEKYIDFIQDFIHDLEDSNLPEGRELSEAIVYENEESLVSAQSYNCMETDLSVPGFLGWLTGQKHRPLFGEDLSITILFNHECNLTYTEHKICFPIVSACARELTILTRHCRTYEEFKETLMNAFCCGQAFGRS